VLSEYELLHADWGTACFQVVQFCRTLEPVLRDAGMNHTADRLAALIARTEKLETRANEAP
jgi:hypothetical protein